MGRHHRGFVTTVAGVLFFTFACVLEHGVFSTLLGGYF
jgi:hypothetical protein